MRRARAPFPSCTGCAVLRPRLAFGCGWPLVPVEEMGQQGNAAFLYLPLQRPSGPCLQQPHLAASSERLLSLSYAAPRTVALWTRC